MRTAAERVLYFLIGVLVVFALVVDCLWLYTLVRDRSKVYFNFNVSQLGKTEGESADPEKAYVIEANYYSNAKGNGVALQEVRFNTWTNPDKVDVYGYGMQYLGEYVHKPPTVAASQVMTYVFPMFNYYASYKKESWSANAEGLYCEKKILFDIAGKDYQLSLKSIVARDYWIFGKQYYQYSYPDVFASVMDAIRSCSRGYGDWIIPLDLTRFFDVYAYNESSAKYDILTANASGLLTVQVKFHYDEAGAQKAEQSLFKSIGFDPGYDTTGIPERPYSGEEVRTRLYNAAFDFVAVPGYDGYFARLKPYVREALAANGRTIAVVEIQSHNIPSPGGYGSYFAGFAPDALRGVRVETVTIGKHFGDAPKDLILLDGCFRGTGLDRLTLNGDWIVKASDGHADAGYEVNRL